MPGTISPRFALRKLRPTTFQAGTKLVVDLDFSDDTAYAYFSRFAMTGALTVGGILGG